MGDLKRQHSEAGSWNISTAIVLAKLLLLSHITQYKLSDYSFLTPRSRIMHFLLSTAILVPFAHLALAGCYSGGAPWPSDHAATLAAIQSASYQMELDSPLSVGEHVYSMYKRSYKMSWWRLLTVFGGNRYGRRRQVSPLHPGQHFRQPEIHHEQRSIRRLLQGVPRV